MALTGNARDWQETYVSALQGEAGHRVTDEHGIPLWVPDGRVKQTLIRHGNLLGLLPNKHGDLKLCTVELVDGAVMFSQMEAAGDGTEPIAVRLCNADQCRQLDERLAAHGQ